MKSSNNVIRFYSKRFLLLCSVILFFCSCKKDPEVTFPTTDSISGILYRNCNLEPDSNREVIISLMKSESDVGWAEWSDTVFTDAIGRFKVVHSYTTNNGDDPHFFVLIPSCFGHTWPSASISPFKTLVTNDTMHAIVELRVSNSLSSSDTLYYQFGNAPLNSLIGPFNNGTLGTYDIPIQYGSARFDSSLIYLNWAIGFNNMFLNGGSNHQHKLITHHACTASDTATIVLN